MKSLKFSPEGAGPAQEVPDRLGPTRRTVLGRIGGVILGVSTAGLIYSFVRSLVPNVLYEPPARLKIGSPEQFPVGATYLEDSRLFVLRDAKGFQALSAVCTHLGCTVKMVSLSQPKKVEAGGRQFEEQREFHCPCHGSKYYGDGTNYDGPAPGPLVRYRISVTPEDGQLMVDSSQQVDRDFRLAV